MKKIILSALVIAGVVLTGCSGGKKAEANATDANTSTEAPAATPAAPAADANATVPAAPEANATEANVTK